MERRGKNRALLLSVVCLNEFCFGGTYAWSVFAEPLAQHMGWEYSQVTFAYSLMLMVIAVAGVAGGRFLDRYGPRPQLLLSGIAWGLGWLLTGFSTSIPMLYLTFGVLAGIASGMFYNPGIVTGVRWFPDRQGFASGLIGGIVGAAALVIAPGATFLLHHFGVMHAFRIIGGVFLFVALATAWYITNPPKDWAPQGHQKDRSTSLRDASQDKTWRQMLQDRRAYVIWLALLGASVAGLMMTGHAATIGREMAGISAHQAALLVGILAISNFLGRFLCGSLTDRFGYSKVLTVILILNTLDMALMANAASFPLFTAAIVVVGLCFGGAIAVFPTISSAIFGLTHMGLNYGILFTAYGVAAIIGPMAAAWIREWSGNYIPAFLFAGALSIFSLLMVLQLARMSRQTTPPKQPVKEDAE